MKLLLVAALGAVFAVAAFMLGHSVLFYPAAWLIVGGAFLVLHLVVSSKRAPKSVPSQPTVAGTSRPTTTLPRTEDDEAESGAVAATKA